MRTSDKTLSNPSAGDRVIVWVNTRNLIVTLSAPDASRSAIITHFVLLAVGTVIAFKLLMRNCIELVT